MIHNKHNLKVGDTVILDFDFVNHSEVKIVAFTPKEMYATIHSIDDEEYTWEVMTYRLTPKII
jgi:copper(I)-binding protein